MISKKPSFAVTPATDPEDDALSALSNQLEREIDKRKEERFLLVIIIIVVSDAFIFQSMETWTSPLVIGLIELVGIAVVARKWGIQEVSQFLAMFFQRLADQTRPTAASNLPIDGTGD